MNNHILIQCLSGTTHTVSHVGTFHTVLDLKKYIADQFAYAVHIQRLIHCGAEMKNESTLDKYRLAKNTTVHLVLLDSQVDPTAEPAADRLPCRVLELHAANYIRNTANWVNNCLLHGYACDPSTFPDLKLSTEDMEKISEPLRKSLKAVALLANAVHFAFNPVAAVLVD
jgi:hypothetical protein